MASVLLTRRLRPVDLYAVDAIAASLVALLCIYAASATPLSGRPQEPVWITVLIGLIIGGPVAIRRRWPYTVAVVVSVATAVALGTRVIPSFAAVAPACPLALAFYSLGIVAPDWSGFGTALGCAAFVGAGLIGPDFLESQPGLPTDLWAVAGEIAYALVVVSLAFMIGYTVGERRTQASQLSEQLVRQAATEERLRVARELHDIIAHTMTLIVVKAAVGNHVAEASPQEARDALRVIETTGRGAMLEVRRVLDMLREDTPYAPTPGLDDLPRLAQQATMGGVDVRLEVQREAAEEGAGAEGVGASEAVGLAVYRIVQEAVTNVVKHAAPARCDVTVVVGAQEVTIEVQDDGRRQTKVGGVGHGLIGMRERVGLHGGTFKAGPRADGGFAVTASLPLGGGS